MRTRPAKGRKLFSLAAVCVLVAAVLAPAPAGASRTLPRATAPDVERLPALEIAGAAAAGVAQAEPLPLYTFVDVVALDRVAGLDDHQVEAAVGRQRHRLHLVSTELAHPDEPVWGSKSVTGVSTWSGADKHLGGSDLRPKLHRPSFQGLWTDPVSGLSYARNRWYDARSASWLSEDPMGAVDSPNLYAFVGWGPHLARDPKGLMNDVNNTMVGRAFDPPAQPPADPDSSMLDFCAGGLEEAGRICRNTVQGFAFPVSPALTEGADLYGNVALLADAYKARGIEGARDAYEWISAQQRLEARDALKQLPIVHTVSLAFGVIEAYDRGGEAAARRQIGRVTVSAMEDATILYGLLRMLRPAEAMPSGAPEVGAGASSALVNGVRPKLTISVSKYSLTADDVAWIQWKYGMANVRIAAGLETAETGARVPYNYGLNRRFVRDTLRPGARLSDVRIQQVAPGMNVDETVSRVIGGRQVPANQNLAPAAPNQLLGSLEAGALRALPPGTPILGWEIEVVP